jgi:hydrogenase-4 component H
MSLIPLTTITTRTIMRYPKLRELREAIRALIKGPYTTKFPYAPHIPVERFKGKPQFHEEDCVGCGACTNVCPARAIEMQDIAGERYFMIRWDRCIFCGQCQANCLTGKGIILSNEFDLATTGRRESLRQKISKKLIVCPDCGEVIAPYEQIMWVVKKLGAMAYSNTTLLLMYAQQLGLVPKED